MLHYIFRAREIAKDHGFKYLARYALCSIRIKSRIIISKILKKDFHALNGHVNANGVVMARRFPDQYNIIQYAPDKNIAGMDIVFDRVAVIIHVFYPDLMDEFIQYLRNIPVSTGLFISTDTEEKKEQIKNAINDASLDLIELEIKIVPNRGRDIAPKYIAFRHVYDRYDAFLHLHSKKSLHSKRLGLSWRHYLLDSLIGSRTIAANNLRILSMEKMGVVYPVHHKKIRKFIDWGYDFETAKALLKRIGVDLNIKTCLEFPSGSMFWAKSAAIRPLLELDLQFEDFPEEKAQIDGTLAHALERTILFIAEKSGHKWARIAMSASAKEPDLSSYQFIPLLKPPR
ncbi:rhamnan synthesis F family protein [Daeguia caeni]|uniref:Rhamnan synthesis F family protein n=1 Tax=Daeguia caeni TaxID=439612 RepID=A0ABV9H113_9HYPH